MSLRFRLSLIFAGFAIVLVTVLGLAATISAAVLLRDAAERQLSQAAHQMSERLDLHMFERLGDITTAAGMKTLFDGEDRYAQRAILERLQAAIPNAAWIGLAGPDGRVLVSTGALLEGEDVSARPWFAAGRHGAAALDVHEAKLLQRYLAPNRTEMLRFVDVTAPVLDGKRLVGVLAAHLSWDWANQVRRDVLATIADLEQSELLVVSREGKVLLGPDAELGSTLDVKAASFVQVASTTTGMAGFRGLGWSVVARQPSDIAFKPVTTLTWAISLFGIALAALAALVGSKVAAAIAQPLSRLADHAAGVRQGADISGLETSSRITEVAALAKAVAAAFRALNQKEDELLAMNMLLEERVLSRTGQLEEARRRAESATQAKSDFLATVSHEIRSPLNSIIGFADLLLDEPGLPSDVSRRIRLIHNAGEALTTVINDILDWSKIEAKRVDLTAETFAISCLMATSLELVELQGASKGLYLGLSIADDVPAFVSGDMARLRQIVLNLLNNAVKFTQVGAVVLTVSRADASNLRFEVADTGIGIGPDQLAKLFGRFSQADGSIERRFGGTGLGLAISRALAELMGGTLDVRSELGRGSVFTLTLQLPEAQTPVPRQKIDPRDGHPLSLGKSLSKPFQRETTGGRILIVEDLAVNREVARAMLEKAGHTVVEADNGHRALELGVRESFDLVLMDVQMPGLDGLATTSELRRHWVNRSGRTPIIALTANVTSDRIAAFREVGMDDHVAKPIRRSALLAKVEQWLEKRPTSGTVPSDDDGPTFDRTTFEEVVDLLGAARVSDSLHDIVGRVAAMVRLKEDREVLGKAAHALISLVGVLGFYELARTCRTIERCCLDGTGLDDAFTAMLAASAVCLSAMKELTQQLHSTDANDTIETSSQWSA